MRRVRCIHTSRIDRTYHHAAQASCTYRVAVLCQPKGSVSTVFP